jgi:hypothetical protein
VLLGNTLQIPFLLYDERLDLGLDPAWLTYFLGIEPRQVSKLVGPMRALLPAVNDSSFSSVPK